VFGSSGVVSSLNLMIPTSTTPDCNSRGSKSGPTILNFLNVHVEQNNNEIHTS